MIAQAEQLSRTTEQVGQASTEIAHAIDEVARGATQLSQSAATALSQVGALRAAVQDVAESTEEQQVTLVQTQQAVGDLSGVLEQTTRQVETVTNAGARAAATAREGGAAVAQTIAAIADVRNAVLRSAEKVTA